MSKFFSQTTSYKGVKYQSKKEANYAKELDLRKKAGEIVSWARQVKIPLEVNDMHICNYYIDFMVTYPDGITEYVEVKGYATGLWKLKWRLFVALYQNKKKIKMTVKY